MEAVDTADIEYSEQLPAARLVMMGDRIVACNGYALSLFNADRDDLLGRSLLDLSAPIQPDGTDSDLVLAEKLEAAGAESGKPFRWTCQLNTGLTFPVLIAVGTTTIRDQSFTQYLLFSDSLAAQSGRKSVGPSSALERSKDAVLITNIRGEITYVNPAFEELYGYDEVEILGKNPRILNSNLQPAATYDELWSAQQTMEAASAEIIIKTKTDQLLQVKATNNPILNAEGELIGILSLHKDITDQKNKEERLEAAKVELEKSAEERLARRERQVRQSFELSEAFISASNLTELYLIAVTGFKEYFGLYGVRLFIMDSDRDDLYLAAETEIGEQVQAPEAVRFAFGEGIVGESAAKATLVLVADSSAETEWQPVSTLPESKCELALPLIAGGDLCGVIDLHSDTPRAFADADIRFLESSAGLLAKAIENLRVKTELSDRLLELSRLKLMLDREGSPGHRSYQELPREGYRMSGAAERVETPTGPGAAPSGEADLSQLASEENVPEVVATPMSVRGEIIGALEIVTDPAQPLSSEEKELLESITVPIAEALESARLLEQSRKHAAEMGVVAQVSAAASTILDAEEMLKTVASLTREHFDLSKVSVFALEDNSLFLVAADASTVDDAANDSLLELDLGNPEAILTRAVRSGEPVVLSDVQVENEDLHDGYSKATRSVLVIPLLVGQETLGVIELRSNAVNRFTEDEISIHTTLAAQVAVALKNAYLYANQLETAEQLREVDRLKTEFLATISHELRTPLNSIIGFADVLLEGIDGPLTVQMREDVNLIRESGQHLRNLIGDMLDLSKIEAGMMELRYEEIDLVGLAQEMVANANSLAYGKDLLVDYRLDAHLDSVEADPTRFRQILLNLMGNAVKFTEEGSITLSFLDQNENLLIGVSDTGIGIKVEDMPLVFEQFRQVEDSSSIQEGGTGLGLPISRRLVELHQGEMWIESEIGKGSTFWFTIPKKRPLPRKVRAATSPFTRPTEE